MTFTLTTGQCELLQKDFSFVKKMPLLYNKNCINSDIIPDYRNSDTNFQTF